MYLNFHLWDFEGYQEQCLDRNYGSIMQWVCMIINVTLLSAGLDQNP